MIPLLLAYTAIGSAFDLAERRVPNLLTLAAIGTLGVLNGVRLNDAEPGEILADVAIRAGFAFLALAVLYLCEVESGDIKAGFLFGAALAWYTIPWLVLVCAALAVVVVMEGRTGRVRSIPFFPVLGGAACAVAGGVAWWG